MGWCVLELLGSVISVKNGVKGGRTGSDGCSGTEEAC